MKFTQSLSLCLSAVLFFLVASHEPNLQFPSYSYGLIAESKLQLSQKIETPVSKARLVSVEGTTSSIIFVGDVLLARNIEFLIKKHGSSYPFKGVSFNNIAKNAFVVGNFEASIPKIHAPTEILKMNFSVDAALLPSVYKAGFTHFSLANNHSFDYGQSGFDNTNQQLASSGFVSFGHPSDFSYESVSLLTMEDMTVALIGLHTLTKQPSVSEIKNVLDYASNISEYQIVYVHWGTEYSLKSDVSQRELAKKLVAGGADMIIGHHPHVVQEIELINGVPVFYSLGNYIFDQYFSNEVQEGLLLNLDFKEQLSINLIPTSSNKSFSQPSIMNIVDSQRFLSNLSNRSDVDLRGFIRAGVLPLNRSFATSSEMAIMNR